MTEQHAGDVSHVIPHLMANDGVISMRTATQKDRLLVCRLEMACFGPSRLLFGPWPLTGHSHVHVTIAEHAQKPVGYVIVYPRELQDHKIMHVTAIGVLPHYRQHGIATKLMETLLVDQHLPLWLHVRVKNVAAINLYKKLGLVQLLRKPGFYRNDDALVMVTPDIVDQNINPAN